MRITPNDILTWGRLAQIISEMTPAEREREVLALHNGCSGAEIRMFEKVLVTTEHNKEIADPGQPFLIEGSCNTIHQRRFQREIASING